MRQITIGNVTETVVERADFPPEKIKQILGNETVAILGYGRFGAALTQLVGEAGIAVRAHDPLADVPTDVRAQSVRDLVTGARFVVLAQMAQFFEAQ